MKGDISTMKFELDVVRFDVADVITASGECACETCEVLIDGDVL